MVLHYMQTQKADRHEHFVCVWGKSRINCGRLSGDNRAENEAEHVLPLLQSHRAAGK